MPKAAPIPNMTMKITRGTIPGGGGPFLLSVTDRTTSIKMNVPRNWVGTGVSEPF